MIIGLLGVEIGFLGFGAQSVFLKTVAAPVHHGADQSA
jgi:hypothetical protein